MNTSEEERQPLLPSSDQHVEAATFSKTSWYTMIGASWNIYRLILLYIIYQICVLGPYSSKIELIRDLTCARYYEGNPDLIDTTNQHPCSADIIEKEASWLLLSIDMIYGFTSALSMLYFGKRLTSWGRKPILTISFLPIIIVSAVCAALPKGYPFGPVVESTLITPTHCIIILLLTTIVGGLLGGETLTMCCLRLLVVDNSTAANRTRNLVYLQLGTQIGILSGPLLYGAISYAFPIASSSIDGLLELTFSFISRSSSTFTPSIVAFQALAGTAPVPPDALTGHGNVTPFLLNVTLGVLALVYIWVLIPETAQKGEEDMANDGELTQSNSTATKLSPIQALKPIRGSDGRLDFRMPSLLLCLFFFDSGAGCLITYVLFFGHTFQWGAIDVDWLISSFGVTRLIVILLLLPAAVLYLEKRVKRPVPLQHLSVEQIKELAKGSAADETPAEESAYACAQDVEEEEHLIQGSISLWRARVDRIVVRASWVFELIGWTTVALGAMFKHQGVMLLGGVIIGLGTGSLPAFQSFGVAITSDVLARSHSGPTAGSNGRAAEVFFALASLVDSIFGTIMPPVQNLIYSSTLTIFPATPFFAAVFYYSIAYIALSTITIHRF